MTSSRLGYACINMSLAFGPKNKRIIINNTCTQKTFETKGIPYVYDLIEKNLKAVIKILEWNYQHGILFYRMSSDMFPHYTNPKFINSSNKFAYSIDKFNNYFTRIGELAEKYNIRLTFHPGQFVQIGTPNPLVFEKSKLDLEYHASILDKCNLPPESVMVVHGGGTYKDKDTTIKRWCKQFHTLPDSVKNRLVIENCERQYNYKDCLYISKKIKRPVIFDIHHHNCYSELIEPLPDPIEFIDDIIETWGDIKPKIHISEQALDKKIGAHSNYVLNIPDWCFEKNLDIMIEAKYKEQAVLYLYDKYFTYDPTKKNLVWSLKK